VGAGNLAQRNVSELSDGERQKIMIARALAQSPMVMLLDEPTAFLDLPRRVEIMQLLRQLVRDTNQAILLSTHDLDLALRLADKIWLLGNNGILHVGAPEDLILNGIFADTFRSESVAVIWTIRALKRVGFVVIQDDQSTQVTVDVISASEGVFWRVTNSQAVSTHHSLYEVIKFLDFL